MSKIKVLKCITLTVLILSVVFCSACENTLQKKSHAITYDNQTPLGQFPEVQVELLQNSCITSIIRPFYVKKTLSVVYSLEELRQAGLVPCVRCNQGKYYTAARVSDGRYLFMLFDATLSQDNQQQLFLVDAFLGGELVDRTKFLSFGFGLEESAVLKTDPSAWHSGLNQTHYSIHRFADMSMMMIEYKKQSDGKYYMKQSINLNNEYSVLNYLLPIDLWLLKSTL